MNLSSMDGEKRRREERLGTHEVGVDGVVGRGQERERRPRRLVCGGGRSGGVQGGGEVGVGEGR